MSQALGSKNSHLTLSLLYKHSEIWGFFHAFNRRAVAVLSVKSARNLLVWPKPQNEGSSERSDVRLKFKLVGGDDRGFSDFHDCGHGLAYGQQV